MTSNPGHTFLDVNTKYSGNPFQWTFSPTFLTDERPKPTVLTRATKMAPCYEVLIGTPYDSEYKLSEYAWILDHKLPYDKNSFFDIP